ncbi:MAG: LysR family transcriptional regulator [Rhodobacteraceae bacterium]|nr:LysR family transcriptional regulator [Paracoccaceae bacterium]
MRFRPLQALHAVIETGTVTAAAQTLGVSQPAVSNLLAQLEAQTRLKLFHRKSGRLMPTPEAMALYQEVDTVVRGLDHVSQVVTDLQNQQVGQLQVAATHALSFGFLPDQIAGFLESRPNLSVSFQAQTSNKIQEWVLAGLFEIGICELPILHDALTAEIMHFETICVLPEQSILAKHAVLTPGLLDDTPFIVMGLDHMTHRRTREAFQAVSARWRTQIHTHLFHNMLSFVKLGMGVSLIDPFTLMYDSGDGYTERPFKPPVLLDIAIVTSKNRPLSAVGQQFLQHIRGELLRHATHSDTGAAAS